MAYFPRRADYIKLALIACKRANSVNAVTHSRYQSTPVPTNDSWHRLEVKLCDEPVTRNEGVYCLSRKRWYGGSKWFASQFWTESHDIRRSNITIA